MVHPAIRSVMKHKVYAISNVLGLAIGLAVTFLIVLYIKFELSYDAFHDKADRLYRVSVKSMKHGIASGDSPEFTPPLGPAMAAEMPEVENYARISTLRPAYLSVNDHATKVERIAFADSTLFDLFSFELTQGNSRNVLANPFSLVLTPEIAAKLFGETNPVGQIVKFDNDKPYTVTGIIRNPPRNSHIQFDALVSFSTLNQLPNLFLDWNGGNQYITYLLLAPNANPLQVASKLPELMWRNINKELSGLGVSYEPYLQPMRDIHLRYSLDSESIRTNLYVVGIISLLILFIACVNFINLAIAQAVPRSREVGIRKVLGAGRWNLIGQFLGESFVLAGVAVVLALLLMETVSGLFSELTGGTPGLLSRLDLTTVIVIGMLSLLVSLASGLYPALYLSSMETVSTLKGGTKTFKRTSRNVLVILQFGISIGLGIGTIVIARQIDFVKSMNIGFEKENMIVVPLVGDEAQIKSGLLKEVLSQIPGVVSVAASSDVPHDGFTSNGYIPAGTATPVSIHVVDVDEAFLSTYGIGVVQGRSFSASSNADNEAYLINETLARELHWDTPVGKSIRRNGEHEVIGVVHDFHFATLHDKIEPLIITNHPWLGRYSDVTIKIKSGDLQQMVSSIDNAWKRVVPSAPFSYFFLDDAFNRVYKREAQFRSVLAWSSTFAILIALMGLLSLVALSVRQRTKEIGIRKALGASVPGIIGMISKEYLKLVAIANVIAWPAAAYFTNAWLEKFAYHIGLPWWAFLLAGCIAIAAALVTVGIQSLRSAIANPVKALRYE